MTDDQLIGEVLQGDQSCFARLIERHQRALLQYLWNLASSEHDCEELSQETLLRAYRNLSTFDASRSSFRTWLLTIARNLAFNHVAKRRPHLTSELPDVAVCEEPSRRLEHREWFSKLDEALGRLPWEQRSAFVLIEIQELTYAEAAVIEDVPVGTVKSRVSRAKRQIRECLTTNPKNK